MKYIFLGCVAVLTGCTTIGQQITNHNGTVQVLQQETKQPTKPLSAPSRLKKPVTEYTIETEEILIKTYYVL